MLVYELRNISPCSNISDRKQNSKGNSSSVSMGICFLSLALFFCLVTIETMVLALTINEVHVLYSQRAFGTRKSKNRYILIVNQASQSLSKFYQL